MTLEQLSPPDLGTGARGVMAMIDRVADIRAQIAALEAAETEALADLGDAVDAQIEALPAKQRATALPLRDASARLGARVRLSDRAIQGQIVQAQQTVRWFPMTVAAWREGRISRAHVRVITDAGALLDDEDARARFEAEVVPVAERETATRTRPIAERLAERCNPEPFAERHRRARGNRKVRVSRLTDGMARLTLDIPAVLAHAAMDRATSIARLNLTEVDDAALARVFGTSVGARHFGAGRDGAASPTAADGALPGAGRPAMSDGSDRPCRNRGSRRSPGLAGSRALRGLGGSRGPGGAGRPPGSALELTLTARVRTALYAGGAAAASTDASSRTVASIAGLSDDRLLTGVDFVWTARLIDPRSAHARGIAAGQSSRERESEPDERTLDQRRADVITELLLAGVPLGADAGPIAAVIGQVQITVPVLSLLAGDDTVGTEPAELDGYGPIDPATARVLTVDAPGWDRVLTHPITGTVLEVDRYTPTAAQRRYLRARDRHCRFPGCSMPARRCDTDHTHDHAQGGRTQLCNLTCICRRHHVLKHHTSWRVIHRRGGVLEWHDPDGHIYTDTPPPPVAFVPAELIERTRNRHGLYLRDDTPAPF